MSTQQRFTRRLLKGVKALLVALVLPLLVWYFGVHVREAGGTVASVAAWVQPDGQATPAATARGLSGTVARLHGR